MKTNRVCAVVFIVALVGIAVFTLVTSLQQNPIAWQWGAKPAQQYSKILGQALDNTLHVQNAKTMLNYYVNLREQNGMYIGEDRFDSNSFAAGYGFGAAQHQLHPRLCLEECDSHLFDDNPIGGYGVNRTAAQFYQPYAGKTNAGKRFAGLKRLCNQH